MTQENRYDIAISESGYDDEGNYISKTTEIKNINQERANWYKYNSGKTLVDGSIFYLIDLRRR
jgi:hypothetical protein